ncbi:hypothetical protein CYY_000606 [Polysphondylium violaceum]|uniref:Uncharacterized protein n=1 Tax=Polysphondylium violaceum TaxID=133409 RepID=A0A8J4Q3H7_9MYCE|nr:hypothetical protein CYY_000606 [Polysphondylium violaceum]
MKIREIITLLSSNPLFQNDQSYFTKLVNSSNNSNNKRSDGDDSNNPHLKSPKNFISINNQSSEIYYFSVSTSKLFIIKVESTLDNTIGAIKFQELKINVNFEVYKIELNENSRYLAIVGQVNCMIVDLSPSITNQYFSGKVIFDEPESKTLGYDTLLTRSFILDKFFQLSQMSCIIKQVEWHPQSNIHLLILYSNNLLKMYNIQNENDHCEQNINLESLHTWSSLNLIKTNNVKQQKHDKERFVSFCFGANINFWTRFTVFLITDNGDVYNLCPIIPNGCLVESSFYKQFQKHIIRQKEQQQQHSGGNEYSKSYFDYQFKWLMAVTINNVIVEIENSDWIKFSLPLQSSAFSPPLLQGPVFQTSNNLINSSSAAGLASTTSKTLALTSSNNNSSSTSDKNQPIRIQCISPMTSAAEQYKQQNNNSSSSNLPLTPFILIILLKSGECIVCVSCQDTIPMWSTIENNSGIYFEQDTSFPRFLDLIHYETLDLELTSTSTTTKSKPNYLLYSYPSMKFDQFTNSLLFFHNSGVQIAKFPWISQLFQQINPNLIQKKQKEQQQEEEEEQQDLEFENTNLISIVQQPPNNSIIPIVGIDVFSNIKIGTYLIIVPNTFNIIIFDMDGLCLTTDSFDDSVYNNNSSNNNNDNNNDSTNDNNNESTLLPLQQIISPLKNYISNPPPTIPRITLPHGNLKAIDFLKTLVEVKSKVFNAVSYSSQLEFDLQARIKGLELLRKEQLDTLTKVQLYINNIKHNQTLLNNKLTYVWDKQEVSSEQMNSLYQIENEGTPLSINEIDLKKSLKQMNSQISIYSEKINQISKDLELEDDNNNNNNQGSTEDIPMENQKEIKNLLDYQDTRIDDILNKVEKLIKSVQITK